MSKVSCCWAIRTGNVITRRNAKDGANRWENPTLADRYHEGETCNADKYCDFDPFTPEDC
jgi:hypothetical protein